MADLIEAFNSGYQTGSNLGYHISGQAAEDIRLNRETKRQELQLAQAKTDLTQQQFQFEKEKNERERMYENATGVVDLSKQALINPDLFLDDFISAANQFNEQYKHFPGVKLMKFDPDMINPEILKEYLPAANSMYGTDNDPNSAGYAASLAKTKGGLVLQVDENTGQILPVHVGEYLTTLGGNAGLQYIMRKMRMEQDKFDMEQKYKQSQIASNEANVMNKQANTAHTLQKMEDEAGDRRRMQQRSNEYQQRYDENPAAVSSLKSNDKGYYSGINYHKPGEGDTSAVTPQAAVDLKTQWQGKFTDALELAKQGKLSVDQLKNVLAGEKSKIGKDKSLLSDYTEAQVNFTRQLRFEAIQNPDLSPEIKAQMLKIADEMDRTLYREDDEYNVSGDKDSVYNMAVSSQIIDAVSRGDAQGILKNLFGIMNTLGREVQDWSNLTSDNFEKQIGIANAFKSTQPQLLAALFQGRMTNKLYSELATSSLWRSEATNLSTLRNNLYTLANLIKDKKVRPSLESKRDAQVMMLEDAIFNLDKLTTGQAQISSGTAYVAKSPEDAITNSKYTTAIYFNNTKKTADIYYPGDRTKENPRVVSIPILEFKKEYGVGAVGKFFGNFGIGNGNPYGSKFREMGVE